MQMKTGVSERAVTYWYIGTRIMKIWSGGGAGLVPLVGGPLMLLFGFYPREAFQS